MVIQEMQAKYIDDKIVLENEINNQQHRIELLERNNLGKNR